MPECKRFPSWYYFQFRWKCIEWEDDEKNWAIACGNMPAPSFEWSILICQILLQGWVWLMTRKRKKFTGWIYVRFLSVWAGLILLLAHMASAKLNSILRANLIALFVCMASAQLKSNSWANLILLSVCTAPTQLKSDVKV